MDVGETKIVYFDQYCENCKYCKTDQSEDPCYECLSNPVNVHSHRPVKWSERT